MEQKYTNEEFKNACTERNRLSADVGHATMQRLQWRNAALIGIAVAVVCFVIWIFVRNMMFGDALLVAWILFLVLFVVGAIVYAFISHSIKKMKARIEELEKTYNISHI